MDIEIFQKSFFRLKEAYERAKQFNYNDDYYFFRDSTIQRFEFTVECFWKTLKNFLLKKEGIACNSPKSCIKYFFKTDYISEELAKELMKMIDDRNLTSHTYHEEIAEIIFKRMKNHINNLELVLNTLQSFKEDL